MKFFISFIFLVISLSAQSAENSAVVEETDFSQLSAQMTKADMGLVMMLHAENCHFCEMMDQEILSPMERSGDYAKRVFIRKLQVDKPEFVTDFKGKRVSASDFANDYDSRMTPTLVFLDSKGIEQAVKIIGINSIELFSASVDEQIDALLSVIKKNAI